MSTAMPLTSIRRDDSYYYRMESGGFIARHTASSRPFFDRHLAHHRSRHYSLPPGEYSPIRHGTRLRARTESNMHYRRLAITRDVLPRHHASISA
jgi:hypothetical protein